jgi:hypothetical protein
MLKLVGKLNFYASFGLLASTTIVLATTTITEESGELKESQEWLIYFLYE